MALAISAIAHPISMSNAVANVREDEVLVDLRIMLEDLVVIWMFYVILLHEEDCF